MKTKSKLTALASAVMLLGTSAAAFADNQNGRGRDLYDYAQVISSQPIVNYVTVKTPVQECWEETEYYSVARPAGGVAGGTILGAVIGGVIGHQFGSGSGNDAATFAGSLFGAAIGNNRARAAYAVQNGNGQYSRPVERCKTTYRSHQEERINGYRVTYRYHGQKYMTEMPYDPGRKIRVRVDVRPAG